MRTRMRRCSPRTGPWHTGCMCSKLRPWSPRKYPRRRPRTRPGPGFLGTGLMGTRCTSRRPHQKTCLQSRKRRPLGPLCLETSQHRNPHRWWHSPRPRKRQACRGCSSLARQRPETSRARTGCSSTSPQLRRRSQLCRERKRRPLKAGTSPWRKGCSLLDLRRPGTGPWSSLCSSLARSFPGTGHCCSLCTLMLAQRLAGISQRGKRCRKSGSCGTCQGRGT